MIIVLLTTLLQGNKKGQKLKQLALINEERIIFCCILTAFQLISFLKYYNLNLSIKVEIDTSKFIIIDILSQLNK